MLLLTVATASGLAARTARLSRWTSAQRPKDTSMSGFRCGSRARRRLERSPATSSVDIGFCKWRELPFALCVDDGKGHLSFLAR